MKTLALFAAALLAGTTAFASEKGGMPDLAQLDQTCLPTSAANLMIWFGKHGYPNLILPGNTDEARANRIIHAIMADTGARYDIGTEMDGVTHGLEAYIHRAGYGCDVEYRGIEGKAPFTQKWLQENDDPDKGFVLLLTYCRYDARSETFTDAWNAGHAVTLVNAEPDLLLIHDPAHFSSETGRKIITPHVLTRGTFQDGSEQLSVGGLMMLTGSLLGAPPHTEVMLTGAVCITLHKTGPASGASSSGSNTILAGTPNASQHAKATSGGWWAWLAGLVLGK